MLYASKDAAPVSAKQGPVNSTVDFNINSAPGQNSVIDQAQQFYEPALFSRITLKRIEFGKLTRLAKQVGLLWETGFVITPRSSLVPLRSLPILLRSLSAPFSFHATPFL